MRNHRSTSGRAKWVAILGALACAMGVLLVGNITWLSATVPGIEAPVRLTLNDANRAIPALALAAGAAALALSIAGKIMRLILGVLLTLLGLGIATLASGMTANIAVTMSRAIAGVTGLTTSDAVLETGEVEVNAVPFTLLLVCAVAIAIIGLWVAVRGHTWPAGGRRYEAAPPRDEATPRDRHDKQGDRISDWDALSKGDDPSDDIR